MHKFYFIFTIFLLSTLFSGCHQRKCLDKNAYNGLYNALTCDYEGRIQELESNITQYELKNDNEIKSYHRLLNEVTYKEREVENYNTSIEELDILINDIDNTLDKVTTNQAIEPLLYQIRNRVIHMKKKLNKERK